MWDELGKQIALEQEQLNRLIDTHRALVLRCAVEPPNDVELSALGFFLHSFYSGVENIFKRIAIELDGGLPQGEAWHRQLLDRMSTGNRLRSAAISAALYETLSEYLAFRHVVRQSYSFHLQWQKMSELVLNCEMTMRVFEEELESFLADR